MNKQYTQEKINKFREIYDDLSTNLDVNELFDFCIGTAVKIFIKNNIELPYFIEECTKIYLQYDKELKKMRKKD